MWTVPKPTWCVSTTLYWGHFSFGQKSCPVQSDTRNTAKSAKTTCAIFTESSEEVQMQLHKQYCNLKVHQSDALLHQIISDTLT